MTLKARVTISAVIALFLVITALLVFGQFNENSIEDRFQEASLTGKAALWKKIIASQFDHMESNTRSITRDRNTLNALKSRNTALIAENISTTYNMLSAGGILTKLQIIDLNGQVLFSAPDNFEGKTRKALPGLSLEKGQVLRGIERDDDDMLYANLAIPVYVRGKLVGVVLYMRDLQGAIEDFKLNDNSDTFIVNNNNYVEYATDRNLLKQLSPTLPKLGTQTMSVEKVNEHIYSVAIQPLFGPDNRAFAHLVSANDQTESYRAEEIFSFYSYASIIIILLVSITGLTWYLRKSFSALDTVVGMMDRISKGDLSERITISSRNDEIGKLLRAMNSMTDNFRRIVGEVYTATDNIDKTSNSISIRNAELSQRTQEQSSSLEETAASMEEMTSTVRQNSESAQQTNQLASTALHSAENGKQVVGRTIDAMSEISDSSEKITDIITTIDSIAFQTNLLALNAAVEAARAGEQGRGFAVVASEVRVLAQRSASAAKEIKSLVQDSVEKSKAGTVLVDESGQTLTDIVDNIKKVANIIAEINIASREQSSGIDQINIAIAQMDTMTQQNETLVDASASANHLLQDQAKSLTALMDFFKLDQESARN